MCSVTQACPTLCGPMDCRPPGSSAHGIFQARILEWGDISYLKGSSWPRDWTWVSCVSFISRWIFTTSTTWEAQPLRLALLLWTRKEKLREVNVPPSDMTEWLNIKNINVINNIRLAVNNESRDPNSNLSKICPHVLYSILSLVIWMRKGGPKRKGYIYAQSWFTLLYSRK